MPIFLFPALKLLWLTVQRYLLIKQLRLLEDEIVALINESNAAEPILEVGDDLAATMERGQDKLWNSSHELIKALANKTPIIPPAVKVLSAATSMVVISKNPKLLEQLNAEPEPEESLDSY